VLHVRSPGLFQLDLVVNAVGLFVQLDALRLPFAEILARALLGKLDLVPAEALLVEGGFVIQT
jgi:hypothetical protein